MDLKTYKIIAAICVVVCFHISSNAAQTPAANNTQNGNNTKPDPSPGSNQAPDSKPDQSGGSGGAGGVSLSSGGSGGAGGVSPSSGGSGGAGGVSPSSGGSGGPGDVSPSSGGSGSAAGNTCLEGTCSDSDEKKAYACFAKLEKTCPLTAQGSCTTTITKTAQNTTEIKVGCQAGACPDPTATANPLSTTTAQTVTSTCCSTNQCNKYQPADSSAEMHYVGLLSVLTSIMFHLTLNYM